MCKFLELFFFTFSNTNHHEQAFRNIHKWSAPVVRPCQDINWHLLTLCRQSPHNHSLMDPSSHNLQNMMSTWYGNCFLKAHTIYVLIHKNKLSLTLFIVHRACYKILMVLFNFLLQLELYIKFFIRALSMQHNNLNSSLKKKYIYIYNFCLPIQWN